MEILGCNPSNAREAKELLVLGNLILAKEGLFDCFGNLSVRNPENEKTFFQSRSLAPEFVTIDDILELDMEGNVLGDSHGQKPYWERFIHARILTARPDINSVYHGHPDIMIAFADMPDIKLLPVINCGGTFYNGYGYYDSKYRSDLSVTTLEEGDLVAEALGDKWAVLMRGHGVSAGAGNIPELVIDMISMVKNARVFAECLKMGGNPECCSEEEGRAYRASHHKEQPLLRNWSYYVRRLKS